MRAPSAALALCVLASCAEGGGRAAAPSPPAPVVPAGAGAPSVSFSIAGDMRDHLGATELGGALAALAAIGAGHFLVSPGDLDPPAGVRGAIDGALGPGFPWFPVVGNHEAETAGDMAYLRGYAAAGQLSSATHFSPGPGAAATTTYSFDAGSAHFVVLNEYYDGAVDDLVPANAEDAGDASPALRAWLDADLAAAAARSPRYVFVIGHEPAWVLPDADRGTARHEGGSLDAHPANRDAFWDLLRAHGVTAYLCGHTHRTSAAEIGGVLQLDTGHARGTADTSVPSTFLRVDLYETLGVVTTYRTDARGAYERRSTLYVFPRPGA
jgi:hypothetical protein